MYACMDRASRGQMHADAAFSTTDRVWLAAGGISFRTAPVSIREKVAICAPPQPEVLRSLAAMPGVAEAFLLSTCNRTEFYLSMFPDADWRATLSAAFTRHGRATAAEVDACLYTRVNEDAARHLFRVAAGLESMVPGEYEIVHQIKQAAQAAREAGTLGTMLHRLSDTALAASKLARTRARYDECGRSVASVAVSTCKRLYGSLSPLTVMVVGAGETAELTLHYLMSKGVRQVLIANRTFERASRLAALTGGEALPLADCPARLYEADVVLCCSASPHPILTAAMVEDALHRREGRRMVIADLAVPRDVEAGVAELPGVQLLNIDTLCGAGEDAGRTARLALAGRIVDDEVAKFAVWLARRRAMGCCAAVAQCREGQGAVS